MAVYKYTHTVIAVLCTQGSEITVSLSAGQMRAHSVALVSLWVIRPKGSSGQFKFHLSLENLDIFCLSLLSVNI